MNETNNQIKYRKKNNINEINSIYLILLNQII